MEPEPEQESQPARKPAEDVANWESARRRFDAVYNDYLKELERICTDARAHVDRASVAYRRAWLEASLDLGKQEAVQAAWKDWLQAQTDSLKAVDAAGRSEAAWKKLIQGLRRSLAESDDEAIDPCLLHGLGQALIAAAAYGQGAKQAGAARPGS